MWLLGELLTCCPWKCCILCFTYHWPPWAPPPEPTGFPQPFLSLGCKRYTPSLQRPCPYPKKQWDYREKTWAKLLVCDCCSCCWHHRAGGWRRSAPSCPLPSHGPDGWWKHVFCHLQTIFCLQDSSWRNSHPPYPEARKRGHGEELSRKRVFISVVRATLVIQQIL